MRPRRCALALGVSAVLLAAGAVRAAAPASAEVAETTGGVAHTWTNYANAGGTEGPAIGANQTVGIGCKLPGFTVADGNTWWYQISSGPWSGKYYVSADAFYNTPGQTSGSLHGTPFVDPAVQDCGSTPPQPLPPPPPPATPAVQLAQGPVATDGGFRYAIMLSGFTPGSTVAVNCFDSVSPSGFYPFSLRVDGSGSASTASYCFSGDGPDHWVVANGAVTSNHVSWGASPAPGGTGTPGGGTGTPGGGMGTPGGTGTPGGSGTLGGSGTPGTNPPAPPTIDQLCGRVSGGTTTTTHAFGGSSTKLDANASFNAVCGGFGAPGGFHLTPAMGCTVLAIVASAGPVGYKVRDLCDEVALLPTGGDLLALNTTGFKNDLLAWGRDKGCGYLTDFVAGTGAAVAAAATVETGPGAAAVGVGTYRVVQIAGTAACSSDLWSGAFQFGVDLETKHEHDIAVDVARHHKCIYRRLIFGQLSWSAGAC